MKEQYAVFTTQTRQGHYSRRTNTPANQHKAGHYSGLHPEDAPYTTGDGDELEADDAYYTQRPRTSVRRYDTPGTPIQGRTRYEFHPDQTISRRAHPAPNTPSRTTESVPNVTPTSPRRGVRAHPLVYLGFGMMVMVGLWVGFSSLLSWWQLHQADATYGRPRTYQFDAVVGHAGSAENPTHFIVLNLNRHIVVIELAGGDPAKAHIYTGPTLFGDGQDLTPVTAKCSDVNGDGKPDLVLFVQDQRIVFLNTGTQFRPLNPGEHITLPQ